MRSTSTEHILHYAPGNSDTTIEAVLAALGKRACSLLCSKRAIRRENSVLARHIIKRKKE